MEKRREGGGGGKKNKEKEEEERRPWRWRRRQHSRLAYVPTVQRTYPLLAKLPAMGNERARPFACLFFSPLSLFFLLHHNSTVAADADAAVKINLIHSSRKRHRALFFLRRRRVAYFFCFSFLSCLHRGACTNVVSPSPLFSSFFFLD